jgi:hypothetical protein
LPDILKLGSPLQGRPKRARDPRFGQWRRLGASALLGASGLLVTLAAQGGALVQRFEAAVLLWTGAVSVLTYEALTGLAVRRRTFTHWVALNALSLLGWGGLLVALAGRESGSTPLILRRTALLWAGALALFVLQALGYVIFRERPRHGRRPVPDQPQKQDWRHAHGVTPGSGSGRIIFREAP